MHDTDGISRRHFLKNPAATLSGLAAAAIAVDIAPPLINVEPQPLISVLRIVDMIADACTAYKTPRAAALRAEKRLRRLYV